MEDGLYKNKVKKEVRMPSIRWGMVCSNEKGDEKWVIGSGLVGAYFML